MRCRRERALGHRRQLCGLMLAACVLFIIAGGGGQQLHYHKGVWRWGKACHFDLSAKVTGYPVSFRAIARWTGCEHTDMYIYWESRRVGAWVAATGVHHESNEYNGRSSPNFFSRHARNRSHLCCARSLLSHAFSHFCLDVRRLLQAMDNLYALQTHLSSFEI